MAIATRVRCAGWGRVAPPARRAVARLGWPEIAPGLVSFSVLASVGVADGGLFPRSWRLATLALCALAAAALLARRRVRPGALEWGLVAALTAFAAWIAASAAWSDRSSTSLLMAERGAVYAAGVLALVVLAERASLAHLLGGALAGITAACAYGLWIYLFTSPPLDPVEGDLMFQPLGYANAVGIFSAIGILLAVGLALAAGRALHRVAAAVPLLVLMPALYFSESRGAWLALVAGLVCLVVLGGRGAPARIAALLVVGTLGVALPVLVASGFTGENRVHYWHVAWRDYHEHPMLGSGAGSYGAYWIRHRPVGSFTQTAHSLYLQSLAELGPIGLVLIVSALALPFFALRRRREPLVAAGLAGYTAYVLHTGIDWDWELPAVTLAGLVCGAAVLAAGRAPGRRPLSVPARAAIVVPALALAVLASIRLETGSSLPFGP